MATVCQAVPRQTAPVTHPSFPSGLMSLLSPTAMQNDALTHARPLGPLRALGVRVAVQLRPFHRSNVPPKVMQNRTLVQDTWLAPPGGLSVTRQERPFHTSASDPLVSPPSAMQNDPDGQEMLRRLSRAGGKFLGAKPGTVGPPARAAMTWPGTVWDEATAGQAVPRHAKPVTTAAASAPRPAIRILTPIGHHIPST